MNIFTLLFKLTAYVDHSDYIVSTYYWHCFVGLVFRIGNVLSLLKRNQNDYLFELLNSFLVFSRQIKTYFSLALKTLTSLFLCTSQGFLK